jgi:hypothetical protein
MITWGPKGQYVATGVHTLLVSVYYQNLRNAIHSCPVQCTHVHAMVLGQRPRTAKSCKGRTRVPDAIIGTYQLRETTPTENLWPSKVAGVERKASNLALEKSHRKKISTEGKFRID